MTTGEAIKNEFKVVITFEYLYKNPSSNYKISYTLVSLINHDGNSLYCGHYVSDVFDSSTGIWWHYDDEKITQISDLPKGVYIRESHQKMTSGSKYVLFVVYIRTSHLTKHSSVFFQ